LATEPTRYITYAEAVLIHVVVMRYFGESHFGVDDRALIESALARPKHAAVYENADLIRQAATLCFGLIKNHPWVGGNKRTATVIMREFLRLNRYKLSASNAETLELVLAVEADRRKVDEVERWLRKHAVQAGT
jgi:death-on-curing protein